MVHHNYCLANATITMLTQACDHILKEYVTVYYKLCIYYTVYSNRYPGLVALQRGSAVSPRAHSPRSEQLTPRRAAVTQLKWKLQELDTRIATADSSDTAAALEAERTELVKAYDHVIAAGATCSPGGASLPRSPLAAGACSPRGSSSTVGADSSVSVGFGTGYTPPPAVLLQSPPVFGKRAATTASAAAATTAGVSSVGDLVQQPPPPQQPRPTAATEHTSSNGSNRSSISSSSNSSAAVDTNASTNNATNAANSGSGNRILPPPPPRSPRASQQASPQSSVGGASSVASTNSTANNAANNTATATTDSAADMLPSPGKM
jgi:hypothetical protein